MLPDYPSLKKEIAEVLQIFFQKKVEQYANAINEVPKSKIFEGKSLIIRRKTGKDDLTDFFSSEASFELKYDEIPTITIDGILRKLDEAACEFAGKMESSFFKSISEQLNKAGRNVGKKGEPFSAKAVINALRNIFISFDSQGNPKLPSIYIHPNLEDSVKKAFKDIDEDPSLKKEFNEIIQQKREEWRAEEASRKLVG